MSPLGVGDLIAIGKLAKDVLAFLDQIKHSSSDYQELRRELDNLQKALIHVDKLDARPDDETMLTTVKAAAFCCRRPLEDFMMKLESFESSLSPKKVKRGLTKWSKALQWAMLDKEVVKLRQQLGLDLATINVMLATHGLEMISLSRDSSISQSSNLDAIASDVRAHASILAEDRFLIKKLFDVVVNTIVPKVNLLASVTERMKEINLDIYTLLFRMQSSVSLCISPSTWVQEPVLFEDACGRRFPIPSEYEPQMVTAMIESKLTSGPGSLTVKSGQYELHNISNSLQITTQNWSGFRPGAFVKMGVLRSQLKTGACANLECDSRNFKDEKNGQQTCIQCGTWFGISKGTQTNSCNSERRYEPLLKARKRKRSPEEDFCDDFSRFKNFLFIQPIDNMGTAPSQHPSGLSDVSSTVWPRSDPFRDPFSDPAKSFLIYEDDQFEHLGPHCSGYYFARTGSPEPATYKENREPTANNEGRPPSISRPKVNHRFHKLTISEASLRYFRGLPTIDGSMPELWDHAVKINFLQPVAVLKLLQSTTEASLDDSNGVAFSSKVLFFQSEIL